MTYLRFEHTAAVCCVVRLLCLAVLWAAFASAVQGETITQREEAYSKTADGVDAFNRADFAAAESHLESALVLDVAIPEAHFWLGRIYAMKAGSNPEARKKASAHFRRALELNPYGEMGDLFRAWLNKLMGRPQTVLLVPATVQPGSSPSDRIDYYRTDQLLARLLAHSEGKTVFERAQQSYYSSGLTPDTLSQFSQGGRYGWVVAAGVTNWENTSKWDEKRRKTTCVANAEAAVSLGDPLLGVVHSPLKVSASSASLLDLILPTEDSTVAENNCWRNLVDNVAKAVLSCTVDPYNLELLDELLVPTAIPGVFARALNDNDYATVRARPILVALAYSPETDRDYWLRTLEGAQRALLRAGNHNLVSDAGIRAYATAQRTIEPTSEHWQQMALGVGGKLLWKLEFEPLTVRVTKHLLYEKCRVESSARMILLDLTSKTILCSESLACKREKTMLLFGNEDELFVWAAGVRQELADEMSAKLVDVLSAQLPGS